MSIRSDHRGATLALCALTALLCRSAEWQGTAAVGFSGSSTLHAFSGSVTTAQVRVTTTGSGTAMTWCASGELLATNMTTAHAGRDAKMFTMLSAAKWPVIRAAILPEPPLLAGATGCTVRAEIAGCTNDLPAAVSDWSASDGSLSFAISLPLSLKAFALTPPSVLGLIRVADRIDVRCRVDAKPAPASP